MSNQPKLQDLIPSLAPYLSDSIDSQPSDSLPPQPVGEGKDGGSASSLIPHPSSVSQPVSLSSASSFIPHPSSFPQTGPKTPDGKSVSRMNSLQHGLDATDDVFLCCLTEREQIAFRKIRRSLRNFYSGQLTAYERLLVDRMAIQHLRMLRLYRLESEVMDIAPRPGDKWSVIPHLDRFSRYDVRIEKQLRILHNRLLSVFDQNVSDKLKPFTNME